MSEASTSDIDYNDLLNKIGLGTNENKDENNKNETKKKKKVQSNKKPQNQSSKSKNKQPLMNLSEFINPKNSDFQADEDISKNAANVFDISKNENEQKSTESKEPQKVVNSQISTDFDDIHSYSSTENENNEAKSDKKIESQTPEQKVQDEVYDIENVFNIDSDSKKDEKKEEKIEKTQKEETKTAEVQEEKKVDDIPKNPAKSSKKNGNKIKKNLTRINLSQYFDSQSQNSNDEFKKDIQNKKEIVAPKKEEKKVNKSVKEDLNKLNRQTSEIERRISDYLNLSVKKVISDFTTELTNLLNQSDSFDDTIRRYISDFKKNILNSIDFSQNDAAFSNLNSNSIDISPTNDFKDLYRDINDVLPTKPENSLSSFTDCQSKIQSTKNYLNSHISPLVSEIRSEVNKSARATKLKVKKFKLNRQKFSVYDKLYDLERREFEYQIESHVSETKRKGNFYSTASPVSPSSISFFEEDSITDRMRTFSMTPTKSELYREIENIIKLLKARRKKTTTSMNMNLSISSIADTSLSTSFFPISPSQMQEDYQIHELSAGKQLFYSRVIKEIGQIKEESRNLRQSIQRKIQEFSSASSLLMMQYQTQLINQQQQQQQAFAASISLLQTNPQNYFTQTVPPASSNEANVNANNRTSEFLQIANDDDIENEELLDTLRQQADEMNRKMIDELNSTTAFIKKISRGTRRHSVSHTHHHRHHRHSRIDPDPSMQRRNLELSSDISLSNMSDDSDNRVSSKIEKRRDNNSYLDSQKLQIRKNTKNNIQDDFNIKKHQDVKRRKSSSKH